jgi:FkbM family methyltransferase
MMAKYAPSGKFYAFEPLPHLFEYLKKNFGHNRDISLFNIALSDSAGESSFNHVISNPGYSGLVKRRYDRPDEQDTRITVRTDLLDSLIGDARIDLIKIDVEGAELQVLRGGKETIKRNKPFIIFEHGLGGADCYGTTPEDVYDLLCDFCGLKLTLLNRYLRNREPLSRSEFCEQFHRGLNYYFLAYSG